jgi:hypothetical protein
MAIDSIIVAKTAYLFRLANEEDGGRTGKPRRKRKNRRS